MKKLFLFFTVIILTHFTGFAQVEKDVSSTIKKVTVFTTGAQVEEEAALNLQQGNMILSFKNLSPYINKESIRIDGDGSYTILNVQHQNDFLNELEKNKEISGLLEKIEDLNNKITEEETWIKILNDKLDFLKSNKQVTGKDQAINPEVFKSLNAIYGSNLETLNLDLLKRQRLIAGYQKEVTRLNNQLNILNSGKDLPSGTIMITINAPAAKTAKIRFNYRIYNAGWYPSYDIRFTGTGKPLQVSLKANITQNTGVDWKDIALVLSTAKTDISAKIPELDPFYLQFYYPELRNSGIEDQLQGKVAGMEVMKESGAAAATPELRIRGIGTINGQNQPLYIVDGVELTDISSINPNDIEKIDVLKGASATSLYGARGGNGVVVITSKQDKENASVPLTITSKNETSVEYILDADQTILSNSKLNTIVIRSSELSAEYEYQSVPKLSEHAFLIGKIPDWSSAGLLDGEVNVYLENSFVGKSIINTQEFSDTLELSFGVDNNISVHREKLKDFSQSQFIGTNKKVTISWKLSVRNNKSYPVKIKLSDQVPISTTKEIQVETLELSGGVMNTNTGKVDWKLDLKPNESRELVMRYSVKFPKDKKVILE